MKFLKVLSIAIAITSFATAKEKKPNPEIQKLQAEIQRLKSLKLDKENALEKIQAKRWNEKYSFNNKQKIIEDKVKELDNKYSQLASRMSLKQDELQRQKTVTESLKEKWENEKDVGNTFKMILQSSIDKRSEEISTDIPYKISERTLLYSKAAQSLEAETNNKLHEAISFLTDAGFLRLQGTSAQTLNSDFSLYEREEKKAWQFRLGTVFAADQVKENPAEIQTLLRTGKLTGQVFIWRTNLDNVFKNSIAAMFNDIRGNKELVQIPVDVLQNKSLGKGFTQEKTASLPEEISAWFSKGGFVMYFLVIAAVSALLLALERWLVYLRRGNLAKSLMKQIRPMLQNKNYAEAKKLCENTKHSSLAKALVNILDHVEHSRSSAEKMVKETILKEVPYLQKRLSLVSALGASAPLMGLLGTVSGMIKLFNVITDVGTNDPKVLAGGISEALVTTQTGLIIAIPILLIHGYLSEHLDDITSNIQAYSLEVLNTIWPESKTDV